MLERRAGVPANPEYRSMTPLISNRTAALGGTAAVPGDKSISHRALILGALAVGETTISGLLNGEDVLRTADAMAALGADLRRDGDLWHVHGVGIGGLSEPEQVIDVGNSGTGARLIAGVLATHGFTSILTGDASLVRRPMARITAPLTRMGADFVTRSGDRLPMAVRGTGRAVPIAYRLPVPSAQVKSAILLAGLNTPGRTTVIEDQPTRDHSERMLRHFGAEVTVERHEEGGERITVTGQPELAGRPVTVPGDISSAAFAIVAALIRPDSDVTLTGVGINPRRTGLIETLRDMGGRIDIVNGRDDGGEPVADLRVRGSTLRGVTVPPERAPSMIDEYPVLAVAASCAEGATRMLGVGELRVKESDRIALTAEGLAACGVAVEADAETMTVTGSGQVPKGGATIRTALDHRIAMSFLVLGTAAVEAVAIDDGAPIDTSFPGFADLMNRLGAAIAPGQR